VRNISNHVILSGTGCSRSGHFAESKDPAEFAAPRLLKGVLTVQHKYWTYIVASRSGTLYIGMTNNLYVRVRQHKSGEIEGFSSQYHCNRLVYWESFDEVLKAINREKQLKGWRRSKKIALIESLNPRWEDLAEKWGAEMVFAGESIAER
jgi:putative endonuclease